MNNIFTRSLAVVFVLGLFTPALALAELPTPTGLNATTSSVKGVTLTWSPDTEGVFSHELEESTDGENYSSSEQYYGGASAGSTKTFAPYHPGETMYYRLNALSVEDDSSMSYSQYATTSIYIPYRTAESVLVSDQSGPLDGYLQCGEKPSFSAVYRRATTSDGQFAVAYQIRVSSSQGVIMTAWDSGKRALSSPLGDGERMDPVLSDVTYEIPRSIVDYQYTVNIKFWDENGNEGLWSNFDEGKFVVTCINFPQPPQDLRATSPTSTEIVLNWLNDPIRNSFTGFKIERSLDGENFSELAVLPVDAASFVDQNLEKNTIYFYRVRSFNDDGVSSPSSISVKTLSDSEKIYFLPVSYNATLATEGRSGWDKLRSATSGIVVSGGDVGIIGMESDPYTISRVLLVVDTRDLPLEGNITSATYFSSIHTNDCSGEDPCYASFVRMNNSIDPDNISGDIFGEYSDVLLSDVKFDSQEINNPIIRYPFVLNQNGRNNINRGGYTTMGVRTEFDRANILPAIDGQHTNGIVGIGYYEESWSPYLEVIIQQTVFPTTPTDFLAAPLSSSEISLAWTDLATNEDGYVIERSLDNVTYATIATTTLDTVDYTDVGLLPTTTYYYRLFAFNVSGVSDVISTSTQTLAVAPSAATALEVNGLINPIDLKTPKPKFSAIFQDASTTAIAMSYEIQVFSENTMYWDSGKQSLNGNTPVGARTRDIMSDILFPRNGAEYSWHIKFWDQYDNEGEWSTEGATFTMRGK